MAPLMACFLNEVHHTAKLAGSRMPGGRLDPCLLMALDEIANIAPINIPNFMADADVVASRWPLSITGSASSATAGASRVHRSSATPLGCKVFLPGISDTALLKAASELCGQAAFRLRRRGHLTRHDICEPTMLRELPDGWALLIRGSRAPVLAKLPRAWNDKAYRRARRRGRAVYTASAPAVLPETRRFALPVPAAPSSGGNGHREDCAIPWGEEQ